MAGAPSHLELFDNKPQLAKFDGTLPPPELLKGYRAAFINPNSKLLGPKFRFVVFSSGSKGPSGGDSCWGSGFLPTVYQGVEFRSGGDPVLYLSDPPGVDRELQRDSLDALNQLNRMRLNATGDPEIATRISSWTRSTMLKLLGFDHTRLTYKFQGRPFRLTDVEGKVAEPLLS
jgi:hypothetical protein